MGCEKGMELQEIGPVCDNGIRGKVSSAPEHSEKPGNPAGETGNRRISAM